MRFLIMFLLAVVTSGVFANQAAIGATSNESTAEAQSSGNGRPLVECINDFKTLDVRFKDQMEEALNAEKWDSSNRICGYLQTCTKDSSLVSADPARNETLRQAVITVLTQPQAKMQKATYGYCYKCGYSCGMKGLPPKYDCSMSCGMGWYSDC
jgi:RNA polymerase-binding transcription factor DksA